MAKDSVRKKKAKLRQLRYERRKILMSKLKYSGNKLFLVVYIILLAGIGTFLISTFTDTYKPVITGFAGSYECSNQATVDGVFLTTNLTDLTTNTETNFSVSCYWEADPAQGNPDELCYVAFEHFYSGDSHEIADYYPPTTASSVAKRINSSSNFESVPQNVQINRTLQCGGKHGTLILLCLSGDGQSDSATINCIDSVNPTIVPNYPPLSAKLESPSVNFSCNGTDNTGIDKIILYGNFTGTFQENSSINYEPLTYSTKADFSVTGLQPGKYRWACRINDTNNNVVVTNNRTITINDNNDPIVTIESPLNISYTSAPPLNYIASDDFGIDKCKYFLTNDTTGWEKMTFISLPNCTNLSSIGVTGFNILLLSVNDTSGRTVYENINFTIDAPPTVSLLAPANETTNTTAVITFSCNATEDRNLKNVTLYHNINQAFGQNETLSVNGTSVTANFTINISTDGTYLWNCRFADISDNTAFAAENYTLYIDGSSPSVVLVSPQPSTNYTNGSSVLISANITDTSTITVSKANITLPNSIVQEINLSGAGDIYSASFTNTSLLGQYNVTFIAQDVYNNTNSSITTNFVILNSTIIVRLVYPEHEASVNEGDITFIYNVSSETTISNCSIMIDGRINQTDNTITKDVNQNFTVNLENGTYTWRINCTSNFNFTKVSYEYQLIVNSTPSGGQALCGNAVCESGESCSSCAADCGACAPAPSGGGGGGGLPSYQLQISSVNEISVVAGQTKQVSVTVRNTGANTLNDITLSLENCPSGWGCGSVHIPALSSQESISLDLELFLSASAFGTNTIRISARNAQTSTFKDIMINSEETCTLDEQCGENRVCINGACQPLFDIVIVRADSPIKPGDVLDFKYFLWNKVGDPGDYTISYSLGTFVSGSEVVYLNTDEKKTFDSSLNIPTDMPEGSHVLLLTLTKDDYSVSATQNIEVLKDAPVVIDIYISKLEVLENGIVLITFDVSTNIDNDILLDLEERISQNDITMWQKSGNVQVLKTDSFQESIPDLSSGTYQLSIKAVHEGKETNIIRTFKIGSSEKTGPFGSFTFNINEMIPIISVIVLLIIVAVALVATRKLMKKGFPKFKTTDKKPPFKMEKPRNIEKNELQVEKEYEIEEEQEPERLKIEDTENVKEENKEKTEKEVHLSEDEMENPLLFDSRKKKDKK